METLNSGLTPLLLDQSPTRLEGMETQVLQVVEDDFARLRPALRGWKQLMVQPAVEPAAESPTRLEGMETVYDA